MSEKLIQVASELAEARGTVWRELKADAVVCNTPHECFEWIEGNFGDHALILAPEEYVQKYDPNVLANGAFTVVYEIPGFPNYVLKLNVCHEVDSGAEYWQYCLGRQGQQYIPDILAVRKTTDGIPWCIMRKYTENVGLAEADLKNGYIDTSEIAYWADTNGFDLDIHAWNVLFDEDEGPIIVDPTSFRL